MEEPKNMTFIDSLKKCESCKIFKSCCVCKLNILKEQNKIKCEQDIIDININFTQ